MVYSQVIVSELKEKKKLTWHEAATLLVERFGWTHKTASNRIHELIDVGVVAIDGEYRKGLFGRSDPDSRVLFLPEDI